MTVGLIIALMFVVFGIIWFQHRAPTTPAIRTRTRGELLASALLVTRPKVRSSKRKPHKPFKSYN